jgi:hypothetical protein
MDVLVDQTILLAIPQEPNMTDGLYRAGCPAPLVAQGNFPTDEGGTMALPNSILSSLLIVIRRYHRSLLHDLGTWLIEPQLLPALSKHRMALLRRFPAQNSTSELCIDSVARTPFVSTPDIRRHTT